MLKKLLNKNFLIFGLLIIPAIWALFVPGYYGASDDLHIAWLFEFHKTLMAGQIPPRFVPDLSFGFGYPLFNFVFPLPFYIAELFHLLGLNLVDSIKAVFLISVPLSGLFMYLLLREFTSKTVSLFGAVLYIYTPYRAVDLYIRGAIGEILSFVFLPLLTLSVLKLTKDETEEKRWIGIGGLSIAGLILTHNITAYMFSFFLIILFLLRTIFVRTIFVKNWGRGVLKMLLAGILGLLISCYFWLPAITESGLVKYDTVFNFVDHFPTLKQLITPYWGYGASVAGPYDGMSFFLGIANLAVLLIGSFLTILSWPKFSKDKKVILVWALISILVSMFLMNYRSTILWENIPLLPYFQFPWRFLIITTFTIPILVVAMEEILNRKWLSVLLIILTLATTYNYFHPQDFLGREDGYYLNKYIPTPFASSEYLKTQEEYLRLPKETEVRPDKNYPLVTAEEGEIKNVLKINDLNSKIEVDSENGFKLSYSKYLFPGWVAKIDGNNTSIYAGKPFGQIELNVPAGAHSLEIKFEETGFKKLLDAISLAGFLVSLSLVNIWKYSKKVGPFS